MGSRQRPRSREGARDRRDRPHDHARPPAGQRRARCRRGRLPAQGRRAGRAGEQHQGGDAGRADAQPDCCRATVPLRPVACRRLRIVDAAAAGRSSCSSARRGQQADQSASSGSARRRWKTYAVDLQPHRRPRPHPSRDLGPEDDGLVQADRRASRAGRRRRAGSSCRRPIGPAVPSAWPGSTGAGPTGRRGTRRSRGWRSTEPSCRSPRRACRCRASCVAPGTSASQLSVVAAA